MTKKETNKLKEMLSDKSKCYYQDIEIIQKRVLDMTGASYVHNYDASPYFLLNRFDHV